MSNYHLRDKRLSLKAKGLLSVILSLPDDWNYSINGLVSICKEGTTAVKAALDELTAAGYVRIEKMYPDKTDTGRIEYEYNIHERPQSDCKQEVENLPLENKAQLNTKELNTEESNTKERDAQKRKRFTPPTPDDVRAYAKEKGLDINVDDFCDYWESVGWMRGKSKMKDWKATARGWARREHGFNSPKRRNEVKWDDDLRELADALDF